MVRLRQVHNYGNCTFYKNLIKYTDTVYSHIKNSHFKAMLLWDRARKFLVKFKNIKIL